MSFYCDGWHVSPTYYNIAFPSFRMKRRMIIGQKLKSNMTHLYRKNIGPRGYRTFSCSTQLCLKLILLINVKMSTIAGILTFISMINTTSERPSKIDWVPKNSCISKSLLRFVDDRCFQNIMCVLYEITFNSSASI